MSDDDVIRRRLLIDGDGTGDDRRLNLLLKTFLKWSSLTNESPEESQAMQDRMFSLLAQCEHAFKKSRMVDKMSSIELESYEKEAELISLQTEKAKKEIEEVKDELRQAKTVRQNRVECQVIVNAINEQPDRKKTEEKLTRLKKELLSLQEKSKKLDDELEIRRKEFYVLLSSIDKLRVMLEDSDDRPIDDSLDVFDDEDMDILSRKAESDQMETS